MIRSRSCSRVLIVVFSAALAVLAQDQFRRPSDDGKSDPVYKVGGAVSAPHAVYAPNPEYSEEARLLGVQGTCTLHVIIRPDGMAHDIGVVRKLGAGLDEEAVKAVSTWRFDPSLKDGQPVSVTVNVEVRFRMAQPGKLSSLWTRANDGDVSAELELAKDYQRGHVLPKNDDRAVEWWKRAAGNGSAEAEFLLGEHAYAKGNNPDYIDAYVWYSLAQRNGYKRSEKPLKQVAAKMTPDQLSQANQRLQSWQPAKH